MHMLHAEHPGMTRMKNLARSYIWSPSLDTEIEELVRLCELCQTQRPALPHVPIHGLGLRENGKESTWISPKNKVTSS
jgi:hypothetical protein